MSRPERAVAALMRWRTFGESRAREAFARQTHQTQQAATEADDARDMRDGIAGERYELMQQDTIDLDRMDVVRAIEHVAEDALREREDELRAARDKQAEAQQRYVAARAQSRVVEARRDRITHAAADQREKRLFDWMADMHVASRRRTP